MSIQLTADQETELFELARTSERTPDDIAQEAMALFLAAQAEHRSAVERARIQITAGNTVAHDEVFPHLKRRFGW